MITLTQIRAGVATQVTRAYRVSSRGQPSELMIVKCVDAVTENMADRITDDRGAIPEDADIDACLELIDRELRK